LRDVPKEVIDTKLIGIKKRVYTLKKLDPSHDLIPVTPVAHYTMGGIATDVIGRTAIQGLFIVGEAGDNGVNGANRLGGNSLSQGAVFGKISAYEAIKFANKMKKYNGVDYYDITKDIQWISHLQALAKHVDVNELRNEIGRIMFDKIGIIRTESDLKEALESFKTMENTIENIQTDKSTNVKSLLELMNALIVAKATAKSALLREESRGSHFRIDFPEKDRKFKTNTLIALEEINA
jgi:succinate dehydrogenase/fumarate reductase flavoprotein subunit